MSEAPVANFTVPRDERYFEDYVGGAVYEFGGTATITRAEIIDFAGQFDPQSFHVDPEAADNGPFGGLVASGWHTCAVLMRLFVEHYLPTRASLGSPGIDELRWPQPVRPDDVLRLRATVLEARRSRSKPDRGLIRTKAELLNQHGEVVVGLVAINLLACREVA